MSLPVDMQKTDARDKINAVCRVNIALGYPLKTNRFFKLIRLYYKIIIHD